MEEFIYLYESMPYNILAIIQSAYVAYTYTVVGARNVLSGKEGCIMRLHRNLILPVVLFCLPEAFLQGTRTYRLLHLLPFRE